MTRHASGSVHAPIGLITGASQGIGRALVDVALDAGATIMALGRSPARVPGLLFDGIADVRDFDAIRSRISELPVNHVDILVNNAGVFPDSGVGLEDLDVDEVMDTLNVNAVGPLRVIRALLPFLRKSAAPTVLNISSNMGSFANVTSSGSYAYRMSKTALNMLTTCLSREFPELRIFSVHPGWVRTAMGGSQAPLEPRISAEGIWGMATHPPETGLFFDYLGRPLPW